MNYYYLDRNNKAIGSFTLQEIHLLAKSGIVNDSTLIAVEGSVNWVSLSSLRVKPPKSTGRSVSKTARRTKLTPTAVVFLSIGLVVLALIFVTVVRTKPTNLLIANSESFNSVATDAQKLGKISGEVTKDIRVMIFSSEVINKLISEREKEGGIPLTLQIEIRAKEAEIKSQSSKYNAEAARITSAYAAMKRRNYFPKDECAELESETHEMAAALDRVSGKLYADLRELSSSAMKYDCSARPYFNSLPKPFAECRTGSSGNYELTIPTTGDFVIAAETSDPDGETYWMLMVSLAGENSKTLNLSERNKTSSYGTQDSVIRSNW